MAVNSKQKGNTFERKIANYLSERFQTYIGVEKAWKRNTDSGSFFGGKNQSRTEQYLTEHQQFGDIISPESFKYVIECKHYKTPFFITDWPVHTRGIYYRVNDDDPKISNSDSSFALDLYISIFRSVLSV